MNKKAFIAEFIGTFTLVFAGVGAIAADHICGGKLGLSGIALTSGLAMAVMVSATAAISGGHLNPAVTFGLWSARKLDTQTALGYIASQCFGAVMAAILIKCAMPADALIAVNMGTPAPGAGIPGNMALIMEIILTFFLVFVFYGTAVDPRGPKCGGLFIGLTVALGVMMGGSISGAAMNPARYLGPALFGGGLQNFPIYWAGPLLGGIFAAQVYHKQLEK